MIARRSRRRGSLVPPREAPARRFRSEQFVAAPVEDVFGFFGDAANLEQLTPRWLSFRILTPQPIEMKRGARIDYKLAIHGLRVTWQTEIVDWQPNQSFVDVQLRGPYRSWVHTHLFEAHDAGTTIRDEVAYQLPLGFLGTLADRLVVARDLERIFGYRRQQIARLFASGSELDR